MLALLDVNVLVALHDVEHVHHEAANDWFATNTQDGWASCPLTQNGCLRVLSQPAYPNRRPLELVMAALTGSTAMRSHRFWPDDLSLLTPGVLDRAQVLGHRQITDVYLLALAVGRQACFATLDGAIPLAAVVGAQPEQLVRIPTA
jgi:uncharacterized protein